MMNNEQENRKRKLNRTRNYKFFVPDFSKTSKDYLK